MHVRDAVETDADAMAAVADAPTDAMRALVHDRTVRVAEADDGGGDAGRGADDADRSLDDDTGGAGSDGAGVEDAETDADGAGTGANATAGTDGTDAAPGGLLGFVSYDAGRDVVHVTQLAGDPGTFDRLLEEPVGFARAEEMAVEFVVPDGERVARDAAERAGFDAVGPGPSFAGEETTTYRLEPL